jgi:hypothetical protein
VRPLSSRWTLLLSPASKSPIEGKSSCYIHRAFARSNEHANKQNALYSRRLLYFPYRSIAADTAERDNAGLRYGSTQNISHGCRKMSKREGGPLRPAAHRHFFSFHVEPPPRRIPELSQPGPFGLLSFIQVNVDLRTRTQALNGPLSAGNCISPRHVLAFLPLSRMFPRHFRIDNRTLSHP